MNLTILKSIKFWVAFVVAVVGLLVSQGVVVDGSTVSNIIGWAMTLLGVGTTGHAVATTAQPEA